MWRMVLASVLLSCLWGAPPRAHHALAAIYDGTREVRIEGVVTEFRFVNPHPLLALEVAAAGARTEQWWLEMDNRFELAAIGMTGETLQPGDLVAVSGNPARAEPRRLYLRKLERPADGLVYEQVGATPRLTTTSR
jgi:hypothetical protein